MAKCKYCDIPLKWKTPYKKGDRPVELNGETHNCSNFSGGKNNYSKKDKWTSMKAVESQFCDMCGKWWVTEEAQKENPSSNYITINEHINQYHPNGEILDNIDDMCISDKEKEETRIVWNQPKRTTKYRLDGKRVI